MRTVAVICPRFPPYYGGPGIAFERMAPRFQESGIKTVVFCQGDRSFSEKTTIDGMRIIRFNSINGRLGRVLFYIKVILSLAKQRNSDDAIHVFTAGWLTYVIPLLGKFLRKSTAFMMTLLDSDDPVGIKSTKYGGIKAYLFKYYDNYIAINPEQKKRIEKVY